MYLEVLDVVVLPRNGPSVAREMKTHSCDESSYYPLIDCVLFIATNIFKSNLILGAPGGSQRRSFHKQLGSKRLQKRLSGSLDTHVAYLLLQMTVVWLKNRGKTSKTVT
jgi:hypothetical protein